MRVESLYRRLVRSYARETDEPVRADQDHAAFRKPSTRGINACNRTRNNRDERAPARAEIVEPRRVARNDQMVGAAVETTPRRKACSRRKPNVPSFLRIDQWASLIGDVE